MTDLDTMHHMLDSPEGFFERVLPIQCMRRKLSPGILGKCAVSDRFLFSQLYFSWHVFSEAQPRRPVFDLRTARICSVFAEGLQLAKASLSMARMAQRRAVAFLNKSIARPNDEIASCGIKKTRCYGISWDATGVCWRPRHFHTNCIPWVNGNAKRNRKVCPDDAPSTTKEGPLTLMGTSDQPCWHVRSSVGNRAQNPLMRWRFRFGSACFAAHFFPF